MANDIFIWSDSYSLGHPLLDSQHQRLISLCRQAVDLSTKGRGDSLTVLQVVLDQLADSAQEHFDTEFAILQRIGFPLLQEEISEHEAFCTTLSDIQRDMRSARPDISAMRDFLSDWTVEHLLHSDMQYKPYLAYHSN